ncbi:MAG TPA: hypothetical protein VMW53_00675 [archaeon]|nr:hypothetical protein [archaeon]
MCGFIVANSDEMVTPHHHVINRFSQFRGPDLTKHNLREGVCFIHNLLHITGEKTEQPIEFDDIWIVFNGEIYNYKDLGDYSSEGPCIADAYRNRELYKLDGEFAIVIVDFKEQIITAYTDSFSTKPLWVGFGEGKFCFASYKSSVEAIGLEAVRMPWGTNLVYDMKKKGLEWITSNYAFDIKQKKDTYDDWIKAFKNSIRKRTRDVGRGMFMGLSSGYDSGAISCELDNQGVECSRYTVMANETKEILNRRYEQHGGYLMKPFVEDYKRVRQYIKENCEDFKYRDKFNKYNIKKDKASVGLGLICELAQKKDQRVYFSGQGSDEIMSDYGFNGRKFMSHSEFGGKFPKSLKGFFPWHSFYDGTQIKYLNKEEYIAGCYGIETRYPFLDRDLVQEFLWLTPELKNRRYKAPLHEYFKRNDYPFEEGVKKGFRAKDNLK